MNCGSDQLQPAGRPDDLHPVEPESRPTPPAEEDREAANRIKRLLRQIEPDPSWRIGANDLFEAWKETGLKIQDFLESVEHAVFHMRSENGKTIGKPRGWLISKVRKGYYPAPADFVSFEEKQQEQIRRSKDIRVHKPASQEQPTQEEPLRDTQGKQETEEEKKLRFEHGKKAIADILANLQSSEDNTERKIFDKGFGPWYDKLSEEERCRLTKATFGSQQNERVYEIGQFRALRLCFARHQNLNKLAGKLSKEVFQVILDIEGGFYDDPPKETEIQDTDDYGSNESHSPTGTDYHP